MVIGACPAGDPVDFVATFVGTDSVGGGICTQASAPLRKTCKVICIQGSGDPRSPVYIVGEAPGAQEEEKEAPFVGPSGKVLTELLKDAGYSRDDVYIDNVVRCKPPKGKKPTKKWISAASTPPAIIASASPTLIAWAAKATVFIPEAHTLFIVMTFTS